MKVTDRFTLAAVESLRAWLILAAMLKIEIVSLSVMRSGGNISKEVLLIF
jgi:hypothetical protein